MPSARTIASVVAAVTVGAFGCDGNRAASLTDLGNGHAQGGAHSGAAGDGGDGIDSTSVLTQAGAGGVGGVGGQAGATTIATSGAGATSISVPDAAPPVDVTTITFDVPDDAGTEPECEGETCECSHYEILVDTKQSCAIEFNPATATDGVLPFDAESFIEIDATSFRVLAIDRWGAGHIVAWCDGTTLFEFGKQFPLLEYLGQARQPRIASIGYPLFCGPQSNYNGNEFGFPVEDVTYLGDALPEEYLGDPAALAADWDGIIVCMYTGASTGPEWSDTIAEFASVHGGGVALIGEYSSTAQQQADLSSWALGTGIEFVPISLPWAPAATEVSLDCVADVPPIIR